MTEQLSIGPVAVDVVRKDIKHMHLAVYPPTGRVRLAVPLRVSEETMRLFVIDKLGWIKRHQRNFKAQDRLPPREYLARESHYYQGRRYLLRLQPTTGPGYVKINGPTYLDLYARPGSSPAYLAKVLDDWYRATLREQLPALLEKWEARLDVKATFVGIRRMKTKWGSCNPDTGRVWLNLELAKQPPVCLEYIVVHELVHLLERRHSDRFRALLTYHLPQWEQAKRALGDLPVAGEW